MMNPPCRGDIIMLDFDPQIGHEQKKRRPALVISANLFNELGLAVVCPITRTKPRHGFHLALPAHLQTRGCVMTEQIKSLDYVARAGQFIEAAPFGFVQHVRAVVSQFV